MGLVTEAIAFLRDFKADEPQAAGKGLAFKQLNITEATDGASSGAGKVDALQINHLFGGPNATGGRHGLEIAAALTSATKSTNPDRNYVGAAIVARADASDGGTSGAPLGAVFGINPVGCLNPSATFFANLTSGEHNVAARAGSSVNYKSGIQIVQMSDDAVSGLLFDAAIAISNQSGAVGWDVGIGFGNPNGAHPVKTTGALIATSGSATVRVGIDLNSYTFTDSAIATPGFSVSPNGGLDLGLGGVANVPQIAFHSGATQVQYDARIIGSGGNGTIGGGALRLEAAMIELQGTTTGTAAAAGGASALPATPVGYMNIKLNGAAVKVPYYG